MAAEWWCTRCGRAATFYRRTLDLFHPVVMCDHCGSHQVGSGDQGEAGSFAYLAKEAARVRRHAKHLNEGVFSATCRRCRDEKRARDFGKAMPA